MKFKTETNEVRSGVAGDRADNHKTGRGYLPLKDCRPKKSIDKMEEWRKWREDFLNFVDTSNKGMKEFLKEVLKEDDLVKEELINERE